MTAERRKQVATVVFVLIVPVCGFWVYWAATSMLRRLAETGSGGIGGVNGGVLEMLYTVVPPIVTIALARASGSRIAKYWRNAHLAALMGLIILPMMGGLRVIMVSIVVLLPVQLFFLAGALAIWFGRSPTPLTPES